MGHGPIRAAPARAARAGRWQTALVRKIANARRRPDDRVTRKARDAPNPRTNPPRRLSLRRRAGPATTTHSRDEPFDLGHFHDFLGGRRPVHDLKTSVH